MNSAYNTQSWCADSDLSDADSVAFDALNMAVNSPAPNTSSFKFRYPPPPNCCNSYDPPDNDLGRKLSKNKRKKGSGDDDYRLNISQDIRKNKLRKTQSYGPGIGFLRQLRLQPNERCMSLDCARAAMPTEQIAEHEPETERPEFGSIDSILASFSVTPSTTPSPLSVTGSEPVINGKSPCLPLSPSSVLEPSVSPVVFGSNYTVESRRSLCPPPGNWRPGGSLQSGRVGGLDGAHVRERPQLQRSPPLRPRSPAFSDPNSAGKKRFVFANRPRFGHDSRALPSSSGPSTHSLPSPNLSSNQSSDINNTTSDVDKLSRNPKTEATLQEYFRSYDSRNDRTHSLILESHFEKIFANIPALGSDSAISCDLARSLSLCHGNAPLLTQKHTQSKLYPNGLNSHRVCVSRSPNNRVREPVAAKAEVKNAEKKVEVLGNKIALSTGDVEKLLNGDRIGAEEMRKKSGEGEVVDSIVADAKKAKANFGDKLKGLLKSLRGEGEKRLNHLKEKVRRITLD